MSRYIQALTNNVTLVRYKELYAAAAELIGLMLKNLTQSAEVRAPFHLLQPSVHWIHQHFFSWQLHQELLTMAVNKIGNLRKMGMDDKFIVCLNKVSKHFPPFMDR